MADLTARARARLAAIIVGIGFGGIVLMSCLAIVLAPKADRPDVIQQVFSSVLPLLGTWVGTVLAFYFARESLQAATDSTRQLVGRPDPHSPVADVMIRPAKAVTLVSGDRPEDVPLADLLAEMNANRHHRIPILDRGGAVSYVVHEYALTKFAAGQPAQADPLAGRTVADLLEVPELAELIQAIGFVPADATVMEARMEMRRVPHCNDVFVTARGGHDEPIIGWLTNTDLAGRID